MSEVTTQSIGSSYNNTTTDRPLAVITGASSGIGLELARVFAEHNYDLLVVAEDGGIQQVATELGAGGRTVIPAQCDLATPQGVEALYKQIQETGRPVDAIALNAGVGVGGRFLENDFKDELNLISLNVISLVHLSKLVLRDMVARGQGRVLYTSSIAALMPGPYYAVYAASKAFVQSFAEALRYELKDSGITITALQPGATDTNFFARAGMLDTKTGASEKDDPAEVARDGFEALMAGKDHIVAGAFKNKMQAVMSNIMPEPAKAAQHAKQTEPGSGHDSKG